jgi:hypothetical protein
MMLSISSAVLNYSVLLTHKKISRQRGVVWFTECNINGNGLIHNRVLAVIILNKTILISSVLFNYDWV